MVECALGNADLQEVVEPADIDVLVLALDVCFCLCNEDIELVGIAQQEETLQTVEPIDDLVVLLHVVEQV